ncbi:DHHA1 domain-containing protein [Neosynechococcus sphagnicola]|uniref:DHHA1 domain-containing protein n=1 Tax=Neosynechococcus sphagnicola TaxID=1501145 RepID=UPI001EF9E8CC|nr:DHHA1 domain-containing protein [Neosynechococcus sphagnicola]
MLELCKRSGDRPTDISFGLGPRINAVSRIYGNARFCVELLTSQDVERCTTLAEETELANTRRQGLQRQVAQQVIAKLAHLDLSTTHVIVLVDDQWPVGVLGLVAGQMAQAYGRPTILLSTEREDNVTGNASPRLARGSARSVNQLDLYTLVQGQEHLLHSFGGHPFALGLSLPLDNLSLFTEAINRQMRQQVIHLSPPVLTADLSVTVADLNQDGGKDLFKALKLLEPCGMGNPIPRLYLANCWFEQVWHRNLRDAKNQEVRFLKTEFMLRDDSTDQGFPGLWWGHGKGDLPPGRCDLIVELDYNSFTSQRQRKKPHYEIRLIAVRSCGLATQLPTLPRPSILDWRSPHAPSPGNPQSQPAPLVLKTCPSNWDELQVWCHRALQASQPLAIAYGEPDCPPPEQLFQQLVGVVKYLLRTGHSATRSQLCQKLNISPQLLDLGLQTLYELGFEIVVSDQNIHVMGYQLNGQVLPTVLTQFLSAVREAQFRQQYFFQLPLANIQAIAP